MKIKQTGFSRCRKGIGSEIYIKKENKKSQTQGAEIRLHLYQ
jgi:hypothetical protein